MIDSLAQETARSSIEHFKGVNCVNQESFAHHDEITFLNENTKRGGENEETNCHHGCFGIGQITQNDSSSMSLVQIIAVVAIVFGASLIQSVFGFGFGLISVPLMIFFVDLPVAVVAATAVSTVSCSIQWYESRASSARRISQRLVVSALIGMPFGLWMLDKIGRAHV